MAGFAKIISRAFDPVVVFSLLTTLAAARSGLPQGDLVKFLVVSLVGILLPPVGFLILAIKKGWVSNWDVSNRRQRVRVFLVFGLLFLVDYILIKQFGNYLIQHYFFFFLIWFAGFFAITLFWKISGHVALVTLASYYIVQWFGPAWWPVVLAIPLVGWARVVTRRHTLAQVIGGTVYSAMFLLLYETWQSIFR
ncbi:phosphatase PAP2 family protein [Candidatus Gottesmanbacteria bacterium]|nr:phosphatase PAP2 family protein [Candidatus Gottesmanbacteria bacterium]